MTNSTSVHQVIVTLGPRTMGLHALLAEAGATGFRVNASHTDEHSLAEALGAAHAAAPAIPIVVDLQGAKMRLGTFAPRTVEAGEMVEFVLDDVRSDGAVPLPHPEPFAVLRLGDRVAVDDGKLSATVAGIEPGRLLLELCNSGVLQPRKGFNRSDHPVSLLAMTEVDRRLARVALAAKSEAFAVSFVGDGQECSWVRALEPGVHVSAKIERADALAQIAGIAELADTLWICRGDLGAQLGLHALGRGVANVEPRMLSCPVLMAGQVLEHLTEHSEPTRSEICHLTDLMAKGYAGVVLSDETAIGHDPVNATRWAAELVNG